VQSRVQSGPQTRADRNQRPDLNPEQPGHVADVTPESLCTLHPALCTLHSAPGTRRPAPGAVPAQWAQRANAVVWSGIDVSNRSPIAAPVEKATRRSAPERSQ